MAVSDQDKARLSQWDALMVEALRALGWPDGKILDNVRKGDLPADDSPFHFDFKDLSRLAAEQPDLFEAAVLRGYQIKFNTLRGIRSWLYIVTGREPVLDLEEGRESVTAELSQDERSRLETVLSVGWEIRGEHQGASSDRSSCRIEPVRR